MYVKYRLVHLSSGVTGPRVGTVPSLRGLSLPGPVAPLITFLLLFVVFVDFFNLEFEMGSSVFFLYCGGNVYGSGMFHLTQIFRVSVLRDSLVFLCSRY